QTIMPYVRPEHEPADEFRLTADNGDSLAVVGIRRAIPAATDYWDGNWLIARVVLRAGHVSADFPLSIRTEEVATFLAEAARLYETLVGAATFRTMEEQ